MKKFIIIAVMAISALTASAQKGDFHITPHISLGYAGLTGNSDIDVPGAEGEVDVVNNLLGGIGADFEYMLSNSFGLSAGLDYNYVRSGNNSLTTGNKKIDAYTSYSFLNVPILAQYHFGEGFALKAGFQPMFVLEAETSVDGDSESFKDACESVMFAIPVGISYTFSTPITVDLRCNIPVSNLNKGGKEDNKLVGITATVGYRF